MERHGATKASMLQDLERGVATEVDVIDGAVVERGRARGVPTPLHERVVELVHAAECGERRPSREGLEELARLLPRAPRGGPGLPSGCEGSLCESVFTQRGGTCMTVSRTVTGRHAPDREPPVEKLAAAGFSTAHDAQYAVESSYFAEMFATRVRYDRDRASDTGRVGA